MLPSPPRMTIAKAFSAARSPIVGVTTNTAPSSAPAAAASPEPIANVAVLIALDVDAHQRRGVAVLERRAHRLAEPRAMDQQVGARDQQRRGDEDEDAQPRDRDRPEHERLAGQRRDDRLRDAAPDHLLGVLHDDPGADHDEHRRVDVGAAHRPQQHELDQRAEQRRRAPPPATQRERRSSRRATAVNMKIM